MDGHARCHNYAQWNITSLWRSDFQASARVCDRTTSTRWLAQPIHRHVCDRGCFERPLKQLNLTWVWAYVGCILLTLKQLTVFKIALINCIRDPLTDQTLSGDYPQLTLEPRHANFVGRAAHLAWCVRSPGPNCIGMVDGIRSCQTIKQLEFVKQSFRNCDAELARDLKTWRIRAAQRLPIDL